MGDVTPTVNSQRVQNEVCDGVEKQRLFGKVEAVDVKTTAALEICEDSQIRCHDETLAEKYLILLCNPFTTSIASVTMLTRLDRELYDAKFSIFWPNYHLHQY